MGAWPSLLPQMRAHGGHGRTATDPGLQRVEARLGNPRLVLGVLAGVNPYCCVLQRTEELKGLGAVGCIRARLCGLTPFALGLVGDLGELGFGWSGTVGSCAWWSSLVVIGYCRSASDGPGTARDRALGRRLPRWHRPPGVPRLLRVRELRIAS
jgi:hypothetical protein